MPRAREGARRRFLPPLMAHLQEAMLGHVSEITDAEQPYTPWGCPLQAWSTGELPRLVCGILAEGETMAPVPGMAAPPVRAEASVGAATRRI